jgi:hypothetical protein
LKVGSYAAKIIKEVPNGFNCEGVIDIGSSNDSLFECTPIFLKLKNCDPFMLNLLLIKIGESMGKRYP